MSTLPPGMRLSARQRKDRADVVRNHPTAAGLRRPQRTTPAPAQRPPGHDHRPTRPRHHHPGTHRPVPARTTPHRRHGRLRPPRPPHRQRTPPLVAPPRRSTPDHRHRRRRRTPTLRDVLRPRRHDHRGVARPARPRPTRRAHHDRLGHRPGRLAGMGRPPPPHGAARLPSASPPTPSTKPPSPTGGRRRRSWRSTSPP